MQSPFIKKTAHSRVNFPLPDSHRFTYGTVVFAISDHAASRRIPAVAAASSSNVAVHTHSLYQWLNKQTIYGDLGETCSQRRIYRLMRHEKLRSQTGYRSRPGERGDCA